MEIAILQRNSDEQLTDQSIDCRKLCFERLYRRGEFMATRRGNLHPLNSASRVGESQQELKIRPRISSLKAWGIKVEPTL